MPPCGRIKREQHQDEGQIIREQSVSDRCKRRHQTLRGKQRDKRQRRPEGGCLAVMHMPYPPREDRPQRNGKQKPRERQREP